ncbi:hypothetical protein [Hamadaea tsunoensis]|uniref:hypothetical protein n=1 Tax=Hamadaea tsunoensis TaxID=53368 RepID=UPI00040BC8AE|nr:hypothetical protein [Hamadaea tsunoensis]
MSRLVMTNPCTYRQARLARGWDLEHLALRMKFVATLHGTIVPPVGLLAVWLFLWEHQRTELPAFYDDLLTATFKLYRRPTPRVVA